MTKFNFLGTELMFKCKYDFRLKVSFLNSIFLVSFLLQLQWIKSSNSTLSSSSLDSSYSASLCYSLLLRLLFRGQIWGRNLLLKRIHPILPLFDVASHLLKSRARGAPFNHSKRRKVTIWKRLILRRTLARKTQEDDKEL